MVPVRIQRSLSCERLQIDALLVGRFYCRYVVRQRLFKLKEGCHTATCVKFSGRLLLTLPIYADQSVVVLVFIGLFSKDG